VRRPGTKVKALGFRSSTFTPCTIGGEHGRQHVLDVEDGLSAQGKRHVHGLLDAQLPFTLADGDESVLVNGCEAAELAMLADQAVVLVQAEQRDLAVASACAWPSPVHHRH
jgi:hypothetical protein